MYWPGIDADIAHSVCQWTICTKHKASPPAQPMLPWDIPDSPWQEIAADYFTHKGKNYLLVCDQFSKNSFLHKVSTKSVQSLCSCLLKLISQYGLLSLLCMDNRQPFASKELAHFLHCHHIEHSTSSPHFRRSNGFIECHVQTLKTMLSPGQGSPQDSWRSSAGPSINPNWDQHAFPMWDPS